MVAPSGKPQIYPSLLGVRRAWGGLVGAEKLVLPCHARISYQQSRQKHRKPHTGHPANTTAMIRVGTSKKLVQHSLSSNPGALQNATHHHKPPGGGSTVSKTAKLNPQRRTTVRETKQYYISVLDSYTTRTTPWSCSGVISEIYRVLFKANRQTAVFAITTPRRRLQADSHSRHTQRRSPRAELSLGFSSPAPRRGARTCTARPPGLAGG